MKSIFGRSPVQNCAASRETCPTGFHDSSPSRCRNSTGTSTHHHPAIRRSGCRHPRLSFILYPSNPFLTLAHRVRGCVWIGAHPRHVHFRTLSSNHTQHPDKQTRSRCRTPRTMGWYRSPPINLVNFLGLHHPNVVADMRRGKDSFAGCFTRHFRLRGDSLENIYPWAGAPAFAQAPPPFPASYLRPADGCTEMPVRASLDPPSPSF